MKTVHMWKVAMCSLAAVGLLADTGRAAAPVGEAITLYSVSEAKYVKVDVSDGNLLNANSPTALTATEQFVIEDAGGGKILLKALCNDLYVELTADANKLKATGTLATDADNQWEWEEGTGGIINLRNVGNGEYVTPNNGGTLKANSPGIKAQTGFTWELAGG